MLDMVIKFSKLQMNPLLSRIVICQTTLLYFKHLYLHLSYLLQYVTEQKYIIKKKILQIQMKLNNISEI